MENDGFKVSGDEITVDLAMMESDYFLGIWSRGMSKSFSTAVFALLDAILHQGVHIGILSKSFRQSKMIFKKIENIRIFIVYFSSDFIFYHFLIYVFIY